MLEKYYAYFKKQEWLKAQKILLSLEKLSEEKDFWLYTSLSSVTYELRNYKRALEYSKIAYLLNPDSPLVLWDYANALYVSDEKNRAIHLWQHILNIPEEVIAFELTTEGTLWARQLRNDCTYRIADAYYYLGDDKLALEYALSHLGARKKGQFSLYSKKEVLSLLKKIEEGLAEDALNNSLDDSTGPASSGY